MDSREEMPPMPADRAELREQILASFLVAVETALREVALTDAVERLAYRVNRGGCTRRRGPARIVVPPRDAWRWAFPRRRRGPARRVLSETQVNVDDALNSRYRRRNRNVAAGQQGAPARHTVPVHVRHAAHHGGPLTCRPTT